MLPLAPEKKMSKKRISLRKTAIDIEIGFFNVEIGFFINDVFSLFRFGLLEFTDYTITVIDISIIGFVFTVWIPL